MGKLGRVRGLAVVVVALLLSPLPQAGADEAPITLGEVTAEAASRADVDVDELQRMTQQAVGALGSAALPRGARAVLSLSLVRLESRASSSAEVSCAVSATLRDRRRGSVLAILEGSARGQDAPGRLRTLERETMRAAVNGAVARAPEALRRRPR